MSFQLAESVVQLLRRSACSAHVRGQVIRAPGHTGSLTSLLSPTPPPAPLLMALLATAFLHFNNSLFCGHSKKTNIQIINNKNPSPPCALPSASFHLFSLSIVKIHKWRGFSSLRHLYPSVLWGVAPEFNNLWHPNDAAPLESLANPSLQNPGAFSCGSHPPVTFCCGIWCCCPLVPSWLAASCF